MKYFALISLIFLCACANGPKDVPNYMAGKNVFAFTDPTYFQHCRAYGCQKIDTLALPPEDWEIITKIFKPSSKNAGQERERLAGAIGTFETKIGAINGTSEDIFGTFKKIGNYQHDCVDESTNTTIYLSLLRNEGLLKFHDIGAPEARIPLIHYRGTWPHQTAVIVERETDQSYAVDSWFHNNGFPAEIVPLETWKSGWRPAKHKK